MSDNAEDYVNEDDRKFFDLLESTDTRSYRASSEDSLLSKDLMHRKEDTRYEFTTSGNSAATKAEQSQHGTDINA
ncbi:hypothetical protein BRC21_00085 [Candidatus Saccharibacteria bacterium SW_7_54_9]|nr:MAG: hypothetical protein BRC21_00085 [Candidatus Saccharibacteria bacterium SW_7_54_9]